MTFRQLITSKKFWTLIAAIVAALTAFFVSGCAAVHRVQQTATSFSGKDSVVMTITYDSRGRVNKL